MNIEQIRANAPYGATGYMVLGKTIMYFGKSHGDTMFYYAKKDEWYLYNGYFGYDEIKPL